ncbi:hypothetical protein HOY82DRAFT_626838 [Tuber indicum]|nr:hypothetical protein HOY82DRAFT_626838 [Tuber indicum]
MAQVFQLTESDVSSSLEGGLSARFRQSYSVEVMDLEVMTDAEVFHAMIELTLARKQLFKPKAICHHHHPSGVHHLYRSIFTTQRLGTSNSGHNDRNLVSGPADSAGGFEPPLGRVPSVPLDHCRRLDKDVSVVKVKIEHIEGGQNKVNSELRERGKKLEAGLQELSKKVDRNTKARNNETQPITDKKQVDPNSNEEEITDQALDGKKFMIAMGAFAVFVVLSDVFVSWIA